MRIGPVLMLMAMLGGCSSAEVPQAARGSPDGLSGQLVLTGSSTIGPLAAEIARRFEKAHPAVRIDVQTGGSSRGIADARTGTADIGMASRALKAGERDLTAHKIATDGVGLIVHEDNPVQSLSNEQVVGIYTGAIDNWGRVGGPDASIVVVNKAQGRATRDVFLKYFQLDGDEVRADVIIGENQQGIKTVAGNPHAVGYVSIGAADYEARHGAAIKLLETDGVAPTPETVASGAYPITRPLNLITKGAPEGPAREFIEFARSEKVHDLVEAHDFVPLQR